MMPKSNTVPIFIIFKAVKLFCKVNELMKLLTAEVVATRKKTLNKLFWFVAPFENHLNFWQHTKMVEKITKLKCLALRLFGKRISAKTCVRKMLMKLTPGGEIASLYLNLTFLLKPRSVGMQIYIFRFEVT